MHLLSWLYERSEVELCLSEGEHRQKMLSAAFESVPTFIYIIKS
jgi:hypothetical protein